MDRSARGKRWQKRKKIGALKGSGTSEFSQGISATSTSRTVSFKSPALSVSFKKSQTEGPVLEASRASVKGEEKITGRGPGRLLPGLVRGLDFLVPGDHCGLFPRPPGFSSSTEIQRPFRHRGTSFSGPSEGEEKTENGVKGSHQEEPCDQKKTYHR